jgi:DnaA family protein
MSSPGQQIPLRIGLKDSATYANFYPGANATVVHTLQQGEEPFIYIGGALGTVAGGLS